MYKITIPPICRACIVRLQANCPHLDTTFVGGQHFSGGDYWDDITEICLDCGADLDALAISQDTSEFDSNLPEEDQLCQET